MLMRLKVKYVHKDGQKFIIVSNTKKGIFADMQPHIVLAWARDGMLVFHTSFRAIFDQVPFQTANKIILCKPQSFYN